jgi:hypothetical protein
MPVPIDAIRFDLKAPWQDQIEFFRQKLNLPTEAWDDILKEAHDRAFVVAGAAKADLLDDFRQAVDRILSEGKSIGWFRTNFDAIVEAHGWVYRGARNWRTRVIYQTNIQSSYHAGRYAQLSDPELLSVKPYWVYHHGHPISPRPEHLSWDGIALPATDPWWRTHYTPNGFGCTCWVSAASAREIERKGYRLLKEAPDDGTYDYVDKKTGEMHTLPRGVDYGWDYAPGASVGKPLAALVADKLGVLPAALGADLAAAVLGIVGDELRSEYRQWATGLLDALDAGEARAVNAVVTLGAIQADVLAALAARSIQPLTAALLLRDKELLHMARDAKAAAGKGISRADLLALPDILARPEAVLLDRQDRALVYVFTPADPAEARVGKIVVRVDYLEKVAVDGGRVSTVGNFARTSGLVEPRKLSDTSRYDLLTGKI